MYDLIQNMYEQLKPGGFVMVLLVGISVLGWSRAISWLCTNHGCTGANRSDLQDWIRSVAADQGGRPTLNQHKRSLLRELIEPVQRQQYPDKAKYRSLLDTVVEASGRCYRSGTRMVGVCAAALPLLGLFGTLIGIIQSFDALALFGSTDVQLLSTGISKALITTQTGLLLAVPLVFFYRYMNGRVQQHTKNMELVAHCLLRHRRSIPNLVKHVYNHDQTT
jgi:biopolymer transport protein ExbB